MLLGVDIIVPSKRVFEAKPGLSTELQKKVQNISGHDFLVDLVE